VDGNGIRLEQHSCTAGLGDLPRAVGQAVAEIDAGGRSAGPAEEKTEPHARDGGAVSPDALRLVLA
jgi:hypothetical protein